MSETTAKRFMDFHNANPDVYVMFERFALEAIRHGQTQLSASLIFERMRWETRIVVKQSEGYKLPNAYRAYYARLFMKNNPTLPGFRTCQSEADTLIR